MPLQEINPLLAYPPDLGAALWAMQGVYYDTGLPQEIGFSNALAVEMLGN